MNAPNGLYLQQLVRALADDASMPLRVRNACHHLLGAVDTYDPDQVLDALARLRQIAEDEGVPLPKVVGE